MPALDTNVLVRYLVADDRRQFEKAQFAIERAIESEPLFVPLSVVVELKWVLRARYELTKEAMLDMFVQLLESSEVAFQEEASIEVALSLYADTNTDFADCVHLAIAFTHGQTPLFTFDRKAARLAGATLLT